VKWLIFLFIFSVPSFCEALTLSDLLSQTRLFLKDDAAASSRQKFTPAQLTNLLNNSQKEVNLRTFAVVKTTLITLSAGTTEYSLPTDHIMPLRVTVDFSPIPERTLSHLDDEGLAWVSKATGMPTNYYIRISSSLTEGVSKESIGFIPVSSGTMLSRVEYLSQPDDLVSSGDTPFGLNDNRLKPFHHVLAYRSAYHGYLIIGDFDSASLYLREYEQLVRQMEDLTKTRILFNPNFRGNLTLKPVEVNTQ